MIETCWTQITSTVYHVSYVMLSIFLEWSPIGPWDQIFRTTNLPTLRFRSNNSAISCSVSWDSLAAMVHLEEYPIASVSPLPFSFRIKTLQYVFRYHFISYQYKSSRIYTYVIINLYIDTVQPLSMVEKGVWPSTWNSTEQGKLPATRFGRSEPKTPGS